MGKLRVQDLAKMMGISNQDLVFKLKSIGVRVEGDDAHIDTDIIQAILQGKKLPHPREVILRDEQTPPEVARRRTATTPASVTRRPANPLRPQQRPRTLIQRVESRIQTLPVSERPMPPTPSPAVLAEAVAPPPAEPPRSEAAASAGAAMPAEAPPLRTTEAPARREPAISHVSRPAPPPHGAPPAGRTAPASAPGRPGPARPPQPAAAPTGLATEEQKRRAAERLQEQIERDKKKKGKGAKKT